MEISKSSFLVAMHTRRRLITLVLSKKNLLTSVYLFDTDVDETFYLLTCASHTPKADYVTSPLLSFCDIDTHREKS